ncbi:anaerobic ribonucleoside-triphosphate reductase activating protein [Alicycliphilus denitrificans]|uniref:anaerobic ribonucleoside-triphosphate reductase activating protein n=1 Tax=Alicycliphilus denitrificans TaxID=179636 RepID=UPI00384C64D2
MGSVLDGVARELRVGGLTPFTSIDFPGRLSAVVYVQGCPLRCGYCHNPHLQQRRAGTAMRWAHVLDWLERRLGLIDGVVFSGGEPTVDPMLGQAIGQVRALGFSIGLHTAGTHPRRLQALLPDMDWIGLDIKAPLDDLAVYDGITGIRGSGIHAGACLQAVLDSGVAYEVRTTAHPLWLDEPALLKLAQGLVRRGARRFVLQIARSTAQQSAPIVPDYPSPAAMRQLTGLFEHFSVRQA